MNDTSANHTRNELDAFFQPLMFKFKVAKEIKKQTDVLLASDFNMIDLIRPDENGVSDLMALMMNPKGSHGQGSKFLELFLKHIDAENNYEDINNAEIIREYPTPEARRIDILIKLPSLYIGIENKPWAFEQNEQLDDYGKHLLEISKIANYDTPYLLYVEGSGNSAKTISDSTKEALNNRFQEHSYRDLLVKWLKACLKECEADKVRWFIKDFITWIECNFSNNGEINEN